MADDIQNNQNSPVALNVDQNSQVVEPHYHENNKELKLKITLPRRKRKSNLFAFKKMSNSLSTVTCEEELRI